MRRGTKNQPVKLHRLARVLGPVVQSIVSLTTSLRRQLNKYAWTTLSNMLLFCWKNVRSHIFSTKNDSIFVIFTFKILTKRN